MKIFKFILLFLLFICIGITSWFYYPQYQINRMKKEPSKMTSEVENVSYTDFFRQLDKEEIYHLALGDSIIKGIGANKGENLIDQFSNQLKNVIQKKVLPQNEGINGVTSTELNKYIQEGRYDNEIKEADIITINVGGNDILQVARKKDISQAIQSFETLQKTFSNNLSQLANRIHEINPHATIVFLELYNPIHPEEPIYSFADALLPKWNIKIYEVANSYPLSIVVETTKVINKENLSNLSLDGVHPNASGYSAISELMINEFKNKQKDASI